MPRPTERPTLSQGVPWRLLSPPVWSPARLPRPCLGWPPYRGMPELTEAGGLGGGHFRLQSQSKHLLDTHKVCRLQALAPARCDAARRVFASLSVRVATGHAPRPQPSLLVGGGREVPLLRALRSAPGSGGGPRTGRPGERTADEASAQQSDALARDTPPRGQAASERVARPYSTCYYSISYGTYRPAPLYTVRVITRTRANSTSPAAPNEPHALSRIPRSSCTQRSDTVTQDQPSLRARHGLAVLFG